ncbi:MAG: DUF3465 domain-containing protein [Longimicrobiales bacterium]|nr:DUF3465 domain-containing protein [Longimicrobiales bacterium]
MTPTDRSSRLGAMPRWLRLAVVVAVVVAAAVARDRGESPPEPPTSGLSGAPTEARSGSADAHVAELFAQGISDEVIELSGSVDRVLSDDNEGSRHQRFILRLVSGQTLLVAHNIDLADRVPLERGDHVGLRGEYEWNEQGGVLHWTHHDPGGRRPGGWIDLEGVRYR